MKILVTTSEESIINKIDKNKLDALVIEGIKVYSYKLDSKSIYLVLLPKDNTLLTITLTLLTKYLKPNYVISLDYCKNIISNIKELDVVAATSIYSDLENNFYHSNKKLLELLPENVFKGQIISKTNDIIPSEHPKLLVTDESSYYIAKTLNYLSRSYLILRVNLIEDINKEKADITILNYLDKVLSNLK